MINRKVLAETEEEASLAAENEALLEAILQIEIGRCMAAVSYYTTQTKALIDMKASKQKEGLTSKLYLNKKSIGRN